MSQYRIRIVQDKYPSHPLDHDNLPCQVVTYERGSDYGPIGQRGSMHHIGSDKIEVYAFQKRLQGYSVARGDGFFLIADTKKLGEYTGSPKSNKRNLDAMVKEIEAWARGEVYGYIIDKLVPDCAQSGRAERWIDEDSCWGFYGSKYAIEAARAACPQSDAEVVWE